MIPARDAQKAHAPRRKEITMAKDKDKKELAVSETKETKADKKKENAKKDSPKKQGRIRRWFKELKQEMKKVVWPTKKAVISNSIVVFVAMLGFAAYTFLLDNGFLWLFEKALGGGKS